MKHLKEIDPKIYEADREECASPESIDNEAENLYVARFWTPKLVLEGLISAYSPDEEYVNFQQLSDDGEPVGTPYEVKINPNGILGHLTLRDGSVLHASEGYLKQYGNDIDDELNDMVAAYENELVPVHVTLGGAAGELARREIYQPQSDIGRY